MIKIGLLKRNREYYFVIGLGVVLVFIIMALSVIVVLKEKNPQENPTAIPSPLPTLIPLDTRPVVFYDKTAQSKLLDKKINRRELSVGDQQAKAALLELLPSGKIAGVIHKTSTISVEYIQSLDLFKVEILTANIASAKNEANTWFREQGMSQQGICNLPLGFYLNWTVAEDLENKGFTFSPLPNGC